MRIANKGTQPLKRLSRSSSSSSHSCPPLLRSRKSAPHVARRTTCLTAVGYGQPVPFVYSNLASEDEFEELPTLGWRKDLADVINLGKLVGAGSFGQVRQGTVRNSGDKVAVKTMAKVRGKLSCADTLVKINKEVDMLRKVQGCPSAVRLVGCFEDTHSAHIVTELCQGGDLKRYVEQYGPLCEDALVIVAFEVLKFLKACHDRGIVYADVKPANFVLKLERPFDDNAPNPSNGSNGANGSSSSSYLKAIDMGSSHMVKGSDRLRKRHGTLVYMAPEVLACDYAFKADMWSLGITLFWLFSQAFPYWAPGAEPPLVRMDIMEQLAGALDLDLVNLDLQPWSEMSPAGRDFISRCLKVQEEQRMSVEEALQHPWVRELAAAEECAGAQCKLSFSKESAQARAFGKAGAEQASTVVSV